MPQWAQRRFFMGDHEYLLEHKRVSQKPGQGVFDNDTLRGMMFVHIITRGECEDCMLFSTNFWRSVLAIRLHWRRQTQVLLRSDIDLLIRL